MIKAVLFDVDGVLVIPTLIFSKRYTKERKLPEDHLQYFFQTEFKECVLGKADLKDVLKNHVVAWGWDKSVDELLNYWFSSEKRIERNILDVVNELKEKGIKLFVATNQEKYRAEYLMRTLELDKHFDGAFISSSIGHKKPSKEFFQAILSNLSGLRPDEILFFDDDKENVDGAKEVGIKAYLYTSFEDFKKIIDKI